MRAEISTYPACLLVILLSLTRQARRDTETQRFILVRATLRCNTLLQRFGILPRRAENELVQWMNWPPSMVVASPIYSGLGTLPKYEREGITQRPNLKGDK